MLAHRHFNMSYYITPNELSNYFLPEIFFHDASKIDILISFWKTNHADLIGFSLVNSVVLL